MPAVKKNETRSHYVNRAIPMLMKEGLSQRVAVGKAEGLFNSKWTGKKKAKKKTKKRG
jgi:hypothetical protein